MIKLNKREKTLSFRFKILVIQSRKMNNFWMAKENRSSMTPNSGKV